MSRPKADKPNASVPQPGKSASDVEGLPDAESIVEEIPFVSPSGTKYTILRTDETDASDRPKTKRRRPSR